MPVNETEYISIIIPAHNSQQWLERCLDSVLAAADADCEVVVVDDHSADDTLLIARRYEDADPRVNVITNEGRGSEAARRTGVQFCQGDSVVFVDSDDTIPPTAIRDLRRYSEPGIDIVAANVCFHRIDGTKALFLNGHLRYRTGMELAGVLMASRVETKLLGSKYARYLFDVYPWDAEEGLHGIFHRALLLSMCCAARGRIVVVPDAVVYNHIDRPGSQTALMRITPQAVDRLWFAVSRLPFHRKPVIGWGLDIINAMLIERGLPFGDTMKAPQEIVRLAQGLKLDKDHERLLALVKSYKKRKAYYRKNVREGRLTANTPHVSFIVVAHNDASAVERTVESILDAGFRNIEVVIVDDGSTHPDSFDLHQLAIKYPRVQLKKHASHIGEAAGRLTGLKAVVGRDVMFVRAGDEVIASGLFEAMKVVDNEADIVFFASRRRLSPLLPGILRPHFDPTKCQPIIDGNDAMRRALTDDRSTPMPWPANMMMRRECLSLEHFNVLTKEGDAENWTMLNLLQANPVIRAIPAVGLIRAKHKPQEATRPAAQ